VADTTKLVRPCGECPFRRDRAGAFADQVCGVQLAGQAHAPFVLPCHADPNYPGPGVPKLDGVQQCAGAAVYRANVGLADHCAAAGLHALPADPAAVFASAAELVGGVFGTGPAEGAALLILRGGLGAVCEEELEKVRRGQGGYAEVSR